MKKYHVFRTCTHRPVAGERSIYLEKDTFYTAKDDEKVPLDCMKLVENKKDSEKPEAAAGTVSDIRSKKDVCEELDALKVVYNSKASIKQLEELLDAAKEARKNKED